MDELKPEGYSESGTPIYKYEPLDRDIEPVMGDAGTVSYIDEHLERFFDDEDITVFHEIISDKVHIDIYMIKANEERDFHILLTSGLSSLPMNVPQGAENQAYAEIYTLLPADWKLSQEDFENEDNYWPIRQLKTLARFPHLYGTWIGEGHTIANGNPPQRMSPNCAFEGVILLAGYTLGQEFTFIDAGEKVISVLSMIPLYAEEMDFKLKKGRDALLDKFDKYNISEITDINRKNTCKKKFGLF
ncbi:suppressor of fused domain protein [Flavobacterium sp. MFBS3-15]|uniref:suppressor of fused domain protein n=1 Tax=Flavobacterium sp. MFBS3-15 TaxID=2989816 RepID=UPI0022369C60|nr:suppressor of fused domain protein [Flavobacterium sp. MFBS3-15]MCW4468318.1 suppressor of fused domain protein [Flavobacterium sp. MFBS3-15]